jgi:Na+-translocating ferredoxin:NAD+ oxidoreductase RnfC subunit
MRQINKVHQIRMGGMMMGVDVPNIEHSIGKITNCIFVNNATLKPSVQSCIRCGQCNEVCPVGLLPQQLFWYAKSENMDRAMDYNLRDCIECRCCDTIECSIFGTSTPIIIPPILIWCTLLFGLDCATTDANDVPSLAS